MIGVLSLLLVGDRFFYRPSPSWLEFSHWQILGWQVPAFLILLIGFLGLKRRRFASSRAGYVALICLLVLAGAMLLHPGGLAIVLATTGLVIWGLGERLGWTTAIGTWCRRLARFILRMPVQPLADIHLARRWRRRHPGHSGKSHLHLGRPLARWALPIALALVFIGLFWAANPVWGHWIKQLGSWLLDLNPYVLIPRADRWLFWLLLGAFIWSLTRIPPYRNQVVAPTSRRTSPVLPPQQATRDKSSAIMVGLAVRSLILFNLLFALQTGMDLYYLWGHGALPEGMSYATYAHRGAYPLLATALLAGAFVLIMFRPGGPAERSGVARRLVYLWIGQNVFLMMSAVLRLARYVEVYSLTRWRVAAAIWMLLVAMGLAWLIWRVVQRKNNAWLLRVCTLTTVAVLMICVWVPFDRLIAGFNVRQCAEISGQGVPIDLDYLQHLGVESLPALVWMQSQPVSEPLKVHLAEIDQQLRQQLHTDLENWRAWTVRRDRLARMFPPLQAPAP